MKIFDTVPWTCIGCEHLIQFLGFAGCEKGLDEDVCAGEEWESVDDEQ